MAYSLANRQQALRRKNAPVWAEENIADDEEAEEEEEDEDGAISSAAEQMQISRKTIIPTTKNALAWICRNQQTRN